MNDYRVKENTIRFGSGFIFVTDQKGKKICLGSMKNIKFAETFEVTEIKADNTGIIRTFKKNQKAEITGDILELNFKKLAVLRGGLDVVELEPGTQITVNQAFEAGTTTAGQFYELDHQNYDYSAITLDSIAQGEGKTPATLVKNTDYTITTQKIDGEQISGITFIAGKTYDNTKKIALSYKVAPLAKVIFNSGGMTTINYVKAEIVNTDENGKKFAIELFKASNTGGLELDFKAEDADEPTVAPLKIEGVEDKTRDRGKQLFRIIDEQGV